MILCKDCKFWEALDGEIFGTCSNPKFKRGYNIDRSRLTSDEVLVEDDEGWGFFSGPSFGCVHAEAK